MKYFVIIFLLVFAGGFVSAQTDKGNAALSVSGDSLVNGNAEEIIIANLVEHQIALARAKEWKNHPAPIKKKNIQSLPVKKEEAGIGWFPSLIKELGVGAETISRIEIFSLITVLVFAGVAARRGILRYTSKNKQLRSNIQALRLEKSKVKKDTKLKVIRKNLLKSSANLNSVEGSLAQKAKALKIAKGEIILAAKIKSYELSISSSER